MEISETNKVCPIKKQNIISQNKKQAFCSHIADYKLNMFRLAKSILRNVSDAEEATCEAIVKAYSNINSLKSFNSFKPWIMKITVNEAYAIYNRQKKITYIDNMEDLKQVSVDNTGELWSVVNTLKKEFRIVTILFYYEDMSIKDISRTLDLPTGTVKSRLARARQKLKELIREERNI